MKTSTHKALLLAALFLSPSLFCNDFDVFKEMLTSSTFVEAQEKQTQSPIPIADCQIAALAGCKAEQIAFNRAWHYTDNKELIAAKFALLEECASKAPCAAFFKK
ncbi:hypothetical protein BH09DEP1_BH09DEP1_3160 [soil metagenome]